MSTTTALETEERILQSLDRQLLKIADKLDETFDPDDKDAVKMLKLFRSMMTTRRIWAKEYKLVRLPEPVQAMETPEILADVKMDSGNSQKKTESIVQSAINDVISQFPTSKKENPPQKNGLLRS